MARVTKSLPRRFRGLLRRLFGRPIRSVARTGQVLQVLYDVAQVQREQRRHYRRMGEIALKMVKEGSLQNLSVQRLVVKIEENERILKRQEKQLYMFQRRGTMRDAMKSFPDEIKPPTESPIT
jgi:hypothetical protein